ncbi:YadA family autotransporter adhesin [Paraburkholderia sp. J67]|uniref:YadA family autotransporter adhesin n=1 Tax=Paraburkholderia sp. J67 TaxID=2805435 RepID=UPI002ABE316C|nr:YadA family autotransporter adhesin [Paraburkholderia sp. J67]
MKVNHREISNAAAQRRNSVREKKSIALKAALLPLGIALGSLAAPGLAMAAGVCFTNTTGTTYTDNQGNTGASGCAGPGWLDGTVQGSQNAAQIYAGGTQIDLNAVKGTITMSPDGVAALTMKAVGGNVLLSGVAPGAVNVSSTQAINGSQLFGLASSTASALGGGSSVNADGSISAPQYAVGGQTFSNAGDALSNVDGRTTANTDAISNLQGQMADAVVYDSSAHDSVTLGGVGATTPVALHNVAAGAVNASSFDAVNGSQLYGVASSTASALGGGSSVNADGSISAPQYAVGGQTFSNAGDALSNVDARTTANTDAISNLQGLTADAVMYDSSAHDSVTFGGVGATTPVALHNVAAGAISAVSTDAVNGSQLYATNQQVAKNTGDIADLQTNVSNLGGQMANAISYDSSAHDSITLGGAGATTPVGLHNVAAGTADTDAVNVGQMNDALSAVSQQAANAVNPFVAANGDRATEGAVASGTHATALGANANASAANSVALGAGSVADRDNTVSVGSAGNERQITNVAAGTAGTDAVNVNQLNAASSQSQGYVDSRIAGVQKQVSDVQKQAFGAAAAAMAVAGLPQPTQPGKTMVAAGASHVGGQNGMALGISYVTENNKWVGKLAASSSSQGNTGVTVGAGYQW